MHDKKILKLLVIKPQYDAWPVGFAYVLACLERHGIPFDFIDIARSENRIKDVRILLENNDYVAVASGGLIGFYRFFLQLRDFTHRYHPNVPFILGGNIVKDSSDHLLFDRIGINFGIVGEAETSLPMLMSKIMDRDDDIGDIPGVVYKNHDGDIIRNKQVRLDLKDNNILPSWANFDVDYYIEVSSCPFIGNDLRFMPVLSGRGCVGKCSFCSPSIGGFRKRPIAHVLSEIQDIVSKYDFNNILFYNEMFYPTAKEISEFCYQYKRSGIGKTWITQVRIDSNIDKNTFSLMREAGCIVVSAGIESGSDRVLGLMNKKTTSTQIRSFFRNAKEAGMPANGTFIVGNQGETEDDLKKTIDLVIDEEINTGESLMYVYPGTAVYNYALNKGLIRDEMEHIAKTSGTGSLFSPMDNKGFVNVSDIPDHQFFDIATREVRRYNTSIFNRCAVQNLSYRMEIKNSEPLMSMEGQCNTCGTQVRYQYNVGRGADVGLLGDGISDRLICPKCYKQLSFNIALFKEFIDHFSVLKKRLSERNKIIIGGINRDAMFLLRIDLFDLDYSKVQGFIDFTGLYKSQYYVNYPVLDIDKIVDYDPDCILVVDSVSGGENIIRKLYNKQKLASPEMLHFYPIQLRDIPRKASPWNKLLVWSKDKYLDLRDWFAKSGIPFPLFIVEFAEFFRNKLLIKK